MACRQHPHNQRPLHPVSETIEAAAIPAPPAPPAPEIDESAPFPLWRLITSGSRIPNQPQPKDFGLLKSVASRLSGNVSTEKGVIEHLSHTIPSGEEEQYMLNIVSASTCAPMALQDKWDFRALATQLREYREQNKAASRFAKLVVNNR